MASTFFGLNISGSGLRAANASMNTAANNISNADTEGYSRQTVIQQAAGAMRTFTTYGCAGAGVEALAIERIRDEFYDSKYRTNETKVGEYSEKHYYMQMVEDYFDDDGTSGFTTIFTTLQTSLQEVLKNPGDTSTKQQFVSTATSLTEYFNNLAGNLQQLQKDVNSEIKSKVDQINSLAQELATVNKQINVIELSGTIANELRDQRDSLVDELSKIVDVEFSETPITDSNNPDRETGANRYIVKIAGGQTLVDGNDYEQLQCIARNSNNKINQSDIVGLYQIYWVGGDEFSTSNARLGGELAGLIAMRDGNNGENFRGTCTAIDASKNTATIEVSAAWLTDLNKCNLSGSGTINIGNKLYNYDSWNYQVTKDANGEETYTYTFQLSKDSDTITTGKIGKDTTTGEAISYQGVPYYMEQMNEWIRLFSQAFNSILESGYTDDGNQGVLMFTGTKPDNTQYNFTADSSSVSSEEDSYYLLTADNFSILKEMVLNGELLATKTSESSTDGESQYDNITVLQNMLTDKTKMSFRGCSAGEFLTTLLGDVSLNANSAKTFSENYQTLHNTIQNQRLSISGVDSDEEAVSLVRYQNSYTLASKMISTFTEVYDILIRETGV